VVREAATPSDGMVALQESARTLEAHDSIIRELVPKYATAVIVLHRARYRPPEETKGLTYMKFRILRVEFDNTLAYGPGNIVDFTRLEGGLSGVVAPNLSGKTSLIDILTFGLYENYKHRVPIKSNFIHHGVPGCRVVVEFELGGKLGRICKVFTRGTYSDYSLSYGDQKWAGIKPVTDAIRGLLGEPSTALGSAFPPLIDFISASPNERTALLSAALSLGSYESLERAAAAEVTRAEAAIAGYHGPDLRELDERAEAAYGAAEDATSDATARRTEADAAEKTLQEAIIASSMAPKMPASLARLVATDPAAQTWWRAQDPGERAIAAARAARESTLAAAAAATRHAANLQERATMQRAKVEAEEHRANEHEAAVLARNVAVAYRSILHTDGIRGRLFQRGLALFRQRLNEALRELGAEFEVNLSAACELTFRMPEGVWTAISQASGYQRFVLSLAARLTIWRCARFPRPDAMFVDEGFGACDANNLDMLADALEALAAAPDGPRLVFIVTHHDELKTRLRRVIEIRRGANGSEIVTP